MKKNFCSRFTDEFIEDVFLPITKQMGFSFSSVDMVRSSTNVELEAVFMQFGCTSNFLVDINKMFNAYSTATKKGKVSEKFVAKLKEKWFQNSSNTETVKKHTHIEDTILSGRNKKPTIFYCGKEVVLSDGGQLENF